jgi:hypothetical protein
VLLLPLHAWRLPREEPRRRLHELKQALDLREKLLATESARA